MAKKRRRRLGHITKVEREKVEDARRAAVSLCRNRKPGFEKRMACIEGANYVAMELLKRGF
jgi:hypothetical protein